MSLVAPTLKGRYPVSPDFR